MLTSIRDFLADDKKVDNLIHKIGYVVVGWVIKVLSYLAKKTKNTKDDLVVETVKQAVKKAKKTAKK